MIIFITGPDRCGKDTLIREIRELFHSEIFHQHHYLPIPKMLRKKQVEYEKKMNSQYFEMLNYYIENNISVIYNRCHIDSLVYAPIYREYENSYVLDLEKNFKKHDGIYLIILIDDANKIIIREDGKSQNKGEIAKIQQEIDFFKKYFKLSSIENKLIVDMTNKDLGVGINEVITFIKNHN